MSKDIYLLSGQFAKLCGTTKETLRHYHKKGILIPAKQEQNGYFYYSINQCLTFELIQLFTQTGNSLEEIKKYLNNCSIENFSVLMKKSYQNLLERKNSIEQMIRIVEHSIDYTEESKNKCQEIIIEECPAEYFWSFKIDPIQYEDLNKVSQAVYQFRKFNNKNEFITEYFYTYFIDKKNFIEKNYLIDTISVKTDISNKYNFIKPEGDYLSIYHRGKPETIKNSLDKLNYLIEKHNLRIFNKIYQTEIINNQITQDENKYIVKISIQIKKEAVAN